MGVAHFRKGNLEKAIESFQAAIDITPEDRRAKENLRALEDMKLRFS